MASLRSLTAAGACLLVAASVAGAQSVGSPGGPPAPPPPAAPVLPTPPPALPGPSQALGVPWCGRLAGGVPLAAGATYFFTWDLTLGVSPSPAWRRHGTARLVTFLRTVLRDHRRAHPGHPRIGVADLSLPRGGPFGPVYGGLGHRSHQNGLDADVLYPRRDRMEAPPDLPSQVDRPAAQALVDRFVAAGAQHVFVGQGLGLRGPRGVVVAIPHHLDHLHVRLPALTAVRAPARCPWQPR
jgi:hypothetical protein